ncbi:MAG: ribosomal small subunit methyltransferase [Frankiales bacterium]|nr:ribosomal small subunit methyltransferase [Frankiales bacterium]
MTPPVFLADDVSGDRVLLTGPEGHHAATVRRVRVGETVDLVDGRGTRASCRVALVERDRVELAVVRRTVEPQPSPRLVLVQAIAKGDRGELAVELATEVGVDEIVPWSAARCVVKWDGERGARALGRWRSTAREAAKQSRRSWLPPVREPHVIAQVVELARAAAATLVLHETAPRPLAGLHLPEAGDVLIVVGPEGGITDDEVAALEAVGATAVRLGSSVLRTSTAGAAAAAVVSASTPRWR